MKRKRFRTNDIYVFITAFAALVLIVLHVVGRRSLPTRAGTVDKPRIAGGTPRSVGSAPPRLGGARPVDAVRVREYIDAGELSGHEAWYYEPLPTPGPSAGRRGEAD